MLCILKAATTMGVIVGYDDAEVFAPYGVGCIEAILELIEGLDEFSMKARLLTTVNALVSVLGKNVIFLTSPFLSFFLTNFIPLFCVCVLWTV
jgi:hypothetical protein